MLNLKLFSKHIYLFGPGKNIWTWEEYLNICLFASLVRDHLGLLNIWWFKQMHLSSAQCAFACLNRALEKNS